jgi:hypothetical protein
LCISGGPIRGDWSTFEVYCGFRARNRISLAIRDHIAGLLIAMCAADAGL